MPRKLINKLRFQYHISTTARFISSPIVRFCEAIAKHLKTKVWVNGQTVTYDGIVLTFPKDIGVHYCSAIYWNGTNGFEPYTWKVIRHFVNKATAFIDVGSNIGLYSILAKKICPDVTVLSYEPVPSIFHKNVMLHEANHCPANNVANIAIGEQDGTADMFLPAVTEAVEEQSTGTLRVDSWQQRRASHPLTVKVTTLDNVLQRPDVGDKILIKIDVEDFEANVFRGAAQIMESVKPIFVCEILPRKHRNEETFDEFAKRGYIPFGISSVGLIRFGKSDFVGARQFTDFLIVPQSMAPMENFVPYDDLCHLQWPTPFLNSCE